MGFSLINQIYLRKLILPAHADKDCFGDKPNLSVRSDNIGFLGKTGFIIEKPTLSADNVSFV